MRELRLELTQVTMIEPFLTMIEQKVKVSFLGIHDFVNIMVHFDYLCISCSWVHTKSV